MNLLSKMTFKLVAVVQILAITLLAGCTPCTQSILSAVCHATGDPANPYEDITVYSTQSNVHSGHPNDIFPAPAGGCPTTPVVIIDGKITICHATSGDTNPYDEITVSVNDLNVHDKHAGDIIPAPANGCPSSPVVIIDGKITICHATSSETNPYNKITVSVNGLNGHDKHAGDIIPAPDSGCPTSPVVIRNGDGKITICHATSSETNPYNEITVSVNGLNGHGKHTDDIIPAPKGGCPTSPAVTNNSDGKIAICHATSSDTNPYNEITVSVNGLNGHDKHAGDIIPAPEGGCPKSPVVINNGKITICHATSSKTNPYNEITVSINGLNGHGKHAGDIIPAPAGGCPTTGK